MKLTRISARTIAIAALVPAGIGVAMLPAKGIAGPGINRLISVTQAKADQANQDAANKAAAEKPPATTNPPAPTNNNGTIKRTASQCAKPVKKGEECPKN